MLKLHKNDDGSNFDGARQLYGGSPEAHPTGDGAATKPPAPEEAAEVYRRDLRHRFGEGVPEREVEAFEAVFRVARQHVEHTEAMRTAMKAALRTGAAEGQRRKAAAKGGGADRC
jgi:hypothetical protein